MGTFKTGQSIDSTTDKTNARLSEKAFVVKDLYRHEEQLPEETVPLDDNFVSMMKQWEQHGDDLASATYDDLQPDSVSSPASTGPQPQSSSSNSSSAGENLGFTSTPTNTGGPAGRQIPI
ncbi:hypothetical protein FRC09_003031 [Ceratobasidium sp. 395]|nr:hypothetical protein FRC09_003031 [Ceratobasidium sp. 395]